MAFNLGTILSKDLGIIVGEVAHVINHDSTDVNCVVTGSIHDELALFQGSEVKLSIEVTARLADFNSTPEINDTITHNSKTYRIKRIETDATETSVQLTCEEGDS